MTKQLLSQVVCSRELPALDFQFSEVPKAWLLATGKEMRTQCFIQLGDVDDYEEKPRLPLWWQKSRF